MKIKVERMLDVSKKYGNGSKIYISKKGWNVVITKPKDLRAIMKQMDKGKKCEINLTFAELNVAIDETIKAGYVKEKVKTTITCPECGELMKSEDGKYFTCSECDFEGCPNLKEK